MVISERELVKQAAEADLLTFIKLVAPHRVLGAIHEELCGWWSRDDAKDNQLVLLPRDHQKSAMIAYRVAWWVTKHPESTVLYVSATANLAEKQLKAVKDILLSDIYRFYWPEMVNEMEGKRERWAADEISVDHPSRKAEGVRDATIKAAGITANVTGLHCTIAVLDDVVVPDNAYTQLGRDQVRSFYSQLSSIESTDEIRAVGVKFNLPFKALEKPLSIATREEYRNQVLDHQNRQADLAERRADISEKRLIYMGNKPSLSAEQKGFSTWISKYDNLAKARATIEKGYDPITAAVIPQTQIATAKATINDQLNRTQRYIKETFPDDWAIYNGKEPLVVPPGYTYDAAKGYYVNPKAPPGRTAWRP